MKASHLKLLLNFYPPYLGAGVKVKHLSSEYTKATVEMKLRWWNQNYLKTHFGGSLYSMIDPFYVLMFIHLLGPDYIVWDKEATIKFRRPGKSTMRAEFEVSDEEIEEIKKKLETQEKLDFIKKVEIKNEKGKLIAEVDKVLYFARKDKK
jgi:hypothetical protein